jgi:hypothetical protein
MSRLSSSEVLNLILALTNCQVVVAKFLELAAVARLTELPATEGKTTERVAMMVLVVEIAALQLDLVESPRTVTARNSGEVGSGLRIRCSS